MLHLLDLIENKPGHKGWVMVLTQTPSYEWVEGTVDNWKSLNPRNVLKNVDIFQRSTSINIKRRNAASELFMALASDTWLKSIAKDCRILCFPAASSEKRICLNCRTLFEDMHGNKVQLWAQTKWKASQSQSSLKPANCAH